MTWYAALWERGSTCAYARTARSPRRAWRTIAEAERAARSYDRRYQMRAQGYQLVLVIYDHEPSPDDLAAVCA